MGLDQYAVLFYSEEVGAVETDYAVEASSIKDGESPIIHRWRKHPNLHGWMEALYRLKGGEEKIFNCVLVRLNIDDLDRLEAAVRSEGLPETLGFFFGESQPEHKAEDLAFIAKARKAIGEGFAVFYDSWW